MSNRSIIFILFPLLLFLTGCIWFKHLGFDNSTKDTINLTLDNVIHYSTKFNLDTLQGIFFLENLTYASIKGDVVQQAPIFLYSDSISYEAYAAGLYYLRLEAILNRENIPIDTGSLNQLYIDVNFGADTVMVSYAQKTEYNPYCGAFYTKCRMNVVVVNIGRCIRGVPLFMQCDSLFRKHKGKRKLLYKLDTLPCYQFVNIINYEWINE